MYGAPKRSMLFVPGDRPDMIEKASRSGADAICIDLEDSVAIDEKASSRANAVRALQSLDFGRRARIVRINAIDTPFAYRDLVDVSEAAGDHLDLIMVPKVGSPTDIMFVDILLSQIEGGLSLSRRIGIEAQIETARGFLYAREIASASPRLEAVVFGAGDYAGSMRMPCSGIGELDADDTAFPGFRWGSVMHTIVAAARANCLRCMDGPYGNYKDPAGLDRACRIARAIGFDGKQCIHPEQIDTVNAVFTPSDDEVAQATAVVQAYDAATAEGRGAVGYGACMIDAASVRIARAVLEQKRLTESNSSPSTGPIKTRT